MYSGNNPSALRSQRCITEALITLLNNKPFTSITIKEICVKADLTRQTFYQFFSSKEDVIRHIIMQCYVDFEELLISHSPITLNTLTSTFFHFFKENQSMIRLLINNNLEYILTEQFSVVLPKILQLCVSEEDALVCNPHINSFIVSGLSAMLISWTKSDYDIDEDELTQLFIRLFHQ